MPEIGNKLNPSLEITDDSFIISQQNNYILSIEVGGKELNLCLINSSSNKIALLKRYLLPQQRNFASWGLKIPHIISELEVPLTSMQKVFVSLIHPRATLVPEAMFSPDDAPAFLSINHILSVAERTGSDRLALAEAYNVYGIDVKMEDEMSKTFRKFKFLHHSTAFIENVLIQYKNLPGTKAFLNTRPEFIELIILQNGRLQLYNSYEDTIPENYLYYILNAFEQIKVSPETTEIILTGDISKDDPLYQLLYRYIRHLNFGKRPEAFKFGYNFNQVLPHRLYTLFGQTLCVS